MAQNAPDLAHHVGAHLESRATPIAQSWLSRLREGDTGEDHKNEVLNVTIDLINRVAAAVSDEGVPWEAMHDDVRQLIQLRRAQGYGLPRLVREFSFFQDMISGEVNDALKTYPGDANDHELLPLLLRVHAALRALSHAALEIAADRLERQAARRMDQLERLGSALDLELRSRLNTVHLLIERYKVDSLYLHRSSVTVDYLSRIQDQLESVKSVIEDVFSVEVAEHRLDANSRAHPFQALSAVIYGVCDDVQELARQRGFRIVASQDLPDFLVDANRVRLILINLLTNAIKHSSTGQQEPPPEVSVSARYENGEWQVAVADNGVGISPPDQARIFRRYEKGNTLEAGHGLGLFLAREAVTQLGGRIWVESELGRGTTFYFTLGELPD